MASMPYKSDFFSALCISAASMPKLSVCSIPFLNFELVMASMPSILMKCFVHIGFF